MGDGARYEPQPRLTVFVFILPASPSPVSAPRCHLFQGDQLIPKASAPLLDLPRRSRKVTPTPER